MGVVPLVFAAMSFQLPARGERRISLQWITKDHPELLGLTDVSKLWQTEGLFSDHYLKAHLRGNVWWPSDTEARPVWEFCQQLYKKRYVSCARNNEAFTRQQVIDKILEKLGFPY